jgi:hypothetical protein
VAAVCSLPRLARADPAAAGPQTVLYFSMPVNKRKASSKKASTASAQVRYCAGCLIMLLLQARAAKKSTSAAVLIAATVVTAATLIGGELCFLCSDF